jgi:hypothetical protein
MDKDKKNKIIKEVMNRIKREKVLPRPKIDTKKLKNEMDKCFANGLVSTSLAGVSLLLLEYGVTKEQVRQITEEVISYETRRIDLIDGSDIYRKLHKVIDKDFIELLYDVAERGDSGRFIHFVDGLLTFIRRELRPSKKVGPELLQVILDSKPDPR